MLLRLRASSVAERSCLRLPVFGEGSGGESLSQAAFRSRESPGPTAGLWAGSPAPPLQGRDGTQRCCRLSSERGCCRREPDLLNKLFLAAVL